MVHQSAGPFSYASGRARAPAEVSLPSGSAHYPALPLPGDGSRAQLSGGRMREAVASGGHPQTACSPRKCTYRKISLANHGGGPYNRWHLTVGSRVA